MIRTASRNSIRIALHRIAPFAGPLVLLLAAGQYGVHASQRESTPSAEDAAFFETRVRPLLADKCYGCHGEKEQRGGLRLDSAAALKQGRAGSPVVTPGEPDASALIQAVRYSGKVQMPPAGRLRADELEVLTTWVRRGAFWPDTAGAGSKPGKPGVRRNGMQITDADRRFWSFRPVTRPATPRVRSAAWVKTPIDAFVLAKLESAGLQPAPPADKRTLIRRAYFDLVGLPPTPQEVRAFYADRSPNAFARVVDRLLASPQYGERWGRRWLDLVRYADSNGLDENVAFANAWRYRDFVVAALNADKPYDQFVREQLAGDLLPAATDDERNENLTATGFLSLGAKLLAESDKDKMVMDIVDEQIDVSSKAFMGLTISCARCHDHKFDPFSTQDYYALAGIFKSTKTMQSLATVAMWNERPLAGAAFEAEKRAYEPKVRAAKESLEKARAAALEEAAQRLNRDQERLLAAAREYAAHGEPVSLGDTVAKRRKTLPAGVQVLEAEEFARGNVIKDREGYGNGIGVILNTQLPDVVEWEFDAPSEGPYQLEFRYASAEERPVRLSLNGKLVREKACGENTGSFNPDGQRWEVQGVYPLHAGRNSIRIDSDIPIPHFDKLLIARVEASPPGGAPRSAADVARDFGVTVEAVRLAGRLVKSADPLPTAATLTERVLGEIRKKPEPFYTAAAKRLVDGSVANLKKVEEGRPKAPMAMAVDEGTIGNCRIHLRGNTTTLGDEAPRRFVTVLCGSDPRPLEAKGSGRRELAEWLVNPQHPLTGRVAVNRVWQGHFGEGLVRTPDNWGFLGERPTHPELLDWLAAEFMAPTHPSIENRESRIETGAVPRPPNSGERAPLPHNSGGTSAAGILQFAICNLKFVIDAPPAPNSGRLAPLPPNSGGTRPGVRWLGRTGSWPVARVSPPQSPCPAQRVRRQRSRVSNPPGLGGRGAILPELGGRGPGIGGRHAPAKPKIENRKSKIENGLGWSFKRLHRLIMLSNAYQMRSADSPKAILKDPENRLLWKFNRRRLEAEPFRDSMLKIAGRLDLTVGGSLLTTPNHGYVTNDQSGNAARYNSPRRSLYLPVIRNALFDMFQMFDVGDPSMVNAKRTSTTVAPQALFVMNSPFVLEQAGAFADHLLAAPATGDSARIAQAYREAVTRSPRPDEVARAQAFLARYESSLPSAESDPTKRRRLVWQAFCQILFASNEFIYVD